MHSARITSVFVLLVPLWSCALQAFGQTDHSSDSNNPAYLLRMERIQRREDVCVLLRVDGQYHFERLFADNDKIVIFEGSLAPLELQYVQDMVSAEELFRLTQEEITAPLISTEDELVAVSILRRGYWQNLKFPTRESRKAYQQSLNPLLKWLDTLQKGKHAVLPEYSARNNCQPPRNIELKSRPQSTSEMNIGQPAERSQGVRSQPAGNPFVMWEVSNRLVGRQVETTCIVVYSTGHYYTEKKKQHNPGSVVTSSQFEGTVGTTELQQLQQLLDDPVLLKRAGLDSPDRVASDDLEFVLIAIPRGNHDLKLNFWKYFSAIPQGSGGMPILDGGMKLLRPLNQWLKTNVESREAPSLTGTAAFKCPPAD